MANWFTNGLNTIGKFWNFLSGKEEQNKFNAEQAELNRNWQEKMSNTAVQRQVEDMKAAGINPAGAFMSGNASGASSPGGATASGGSGEGAGMIGAISGLVNSIASITNNKRMSRETAEKFYGTAQKVINNNITNYGN